MPGIVLAVSGNQPLSAWGMHSNGEGEEGHPPTHTHTHRGMSVHGKYMRNRKQLKGVGCEMEVLLWLG